MSEKRFTLEQWTEESLYFSDGEFSAHMSIEYICKKVEKKLNEQQDTISRLEEKNDRLKNKLNVTALELVDESISMGKAVEISEMSYREFIDYRAENGKPMELQR